MRNDERPIRSAYFFHASKVVDHIDTELFDGKDMPGLIPCLPHIGITPGGEWAFHVTGD